MLRKWRELLWWVGAPLLLCLFLSGAFILPRLVFHLSPWWRFPIAAPGGPDAYLYFLWIGAVVQRVPLGEFFYWLIPIFRGIWDVSRGVWSIPELVLVTLMLSATASVWILPWTIRQWTALTRTQSRLLTLTFLSIWALALGFRPGIYSWYSPSIFFGLGALGMFWKKMRDSEWVRAALWGVASLAGAFLYPWYLGFVIVFESVVVTGLLVKKSLRLTALLFVGLSVLFSVAACFVAPRFLTATFAPMLDQYHRTGVTFSHMPFVTNAVLAILLWIVLLIVTKSDEHRHDAAHLVAWTCLLLLWFHYPFTGLFIYNEHFMQVIAVLGLLTLGFVWEGCSFRSKRWAWVCLGIPWAFIFYYVAKSLMPSASVRMYLVHLINWVPLGIAGVLCLRPSVRILRPVGLAILGAMGLWSYVSVVQSQLTLYPAALRLEPVIDWLRQDGPATMRYCTDVENAAILGAHTGRRFYPSEGTIFERVTDDVYFSHFDSIAAVFDVRAAGQEPTWLYYANFGLRSTCDAFPMQEKMLRALRVPQPTIDELTGCPRALIQANEDRMERAIDRKADAKPLTETCDRVVVDDRLKSAWHLPPSATLMQKIGDYSLWNLKP